MHRVFGKSKPKAEEKEAPPPPSLTEVREKGDAAIGAYTEKVRAWGAHACFEQRALRVPVFLSLAELRIRLLCSDVQVCVCKRTWQLRRCCDSKPSPLLRD